MTDTSSSNHDVDIEAEASAFGRKESVELDPYRETRTRSTIATRLAQTVMVIAMMLALTYCIIVTSVVIIAARAPAATPGQQQATIKEAVDALQPLLNVCLSQTLYPLATIAIGWYFASRLSEAKSDH